ncbi:MAG: hypothetical protein GFH27_549293n243 [Chloroflexi bacterium AL-W]|nr:hypothetical protein [Chloroflexi bacterium AL-N1]NOK67642.1 hypothetical protein [Chloroflexi bacterium AL-N10]NOK75588.1 hypothetical protein [Chloroflexi bacterium AL-N5]NOK82376.1 hypothetical protein [Chloroflexi bacterium AL-W]NOK90221.1 hypothetical protein [Chloroflexi bacterium AL-N15]
MLCHYCFKLNIVILTFVLLLSGCGTPNPNAVQTNLDEENPVQHDSSEIIAESEPTSTPEPTDNSTLNNIITQTPGATEPGVAQIPPTQLLLANRLPP